MQSSWLWSTYCGEKGAIFVGSRAVLRTMSGREFDWGGTSVKWLRRFPKMSSTRTETWCRPKGEKFTWIWLSVRIQIVKTLPIDPFDFPFRVWSKRCLINDTSLISRRQRSEFHYMYPPELRFLEIGLEWSVWISQAHLRRITEFESVSHNKDTSG